MSDLRGASILLQPDSADLGSPPCRTLLTVVKAADLVSTLNNTSLNATIFAPTNEAFRKFANDYNVTISDLLQKPDVLKTVVTYHIVPGTYRAADLQDGQKLETLEGNTIEVDITDGVVSLLSAAATPATVLKTDIQAGETVIHLIDGVLLPPNVTL